MSKVTIVSALFNIERVDGRPWEEYLKWCLLRHTEGVHINALFVIPQCTILTLKGMKFRILF